MVYTVKGGKLMMGLTAFSSMSCAPSNSSACNQDKVCVCGGVWVEVCVLYG